MILSNINANALQQEEDKDDIPPYLKKIKGNHFYKEQQLALVIPGYISHIL